MSIFKAYDIRGLFPDQLDAASAHGIGRAVAHWLEVQSLVVARDARRSSPALREALIRGINEEGVDAIAVFNCRFRISILFRCRLYALKLRHKFG